MSILDIENDELYGISKEKDNDFLIEKKYKFNENILKAYKKLLDVYRRRCLLLCSIIKYLATSKETDINYEDTLKQLDIKVHSGLISDDDFDRIILPTIYNIKLLFTYIDEANSFKSYYNNNVEGIICRIPTMELQNEFDNEESIPLSKNQKEALKNDKHIEMKKSS